MPSCKETVTQKHVRLNQNRHQKVFIIGGFTFDHRDLTFSKFDKISTAYSVSYFNLDGMLTVVMDGSVLNFPYAVIT